MSDVTVNIKDFTTLPGGRFRGSGDGSAEEFYADILQPKLDDPTIDKIIINMDGTWGYSISFISQLGLYLRDHLGSFEAMKRKIVLVSSDKPTVVDVFWQLIKEES